MEELVLTNVGRGKQIGQRGERVVGKNCKLPQDAGTRLAAFCFSALRSPRFSQPRPCLASPHTRDCAPPLCRQLAARASFGSPLPAGQHAGARDMSLPSCQETAAKCRRPPADPTSLSPCKQAAAQPLDGHVQVRDSRQPASH